MQNFIMQEAEDKASEIRNKAQEEFSIQKSNIVVVEKQKILKEYERKEKQIGVKKKMYVAKERFRNEVGQVDTRGDGKYIIVKKKYVWREEEIMMGGRNGKIGNRTGKGRNMWEWSRITQQTINSQ
jgi:hypothetical protein